MDATLPFAARAARLTGSVIDSSTSLLAGQEHDVVRFAMGSPAPDAIPTRLLSELAERALAAPAAYDYAATEGDPGLREQIVRFLAEHGREVGPERILVTSGGMQGLDLACKLFVEPGDLVVAEGPTYTNGIATIASYQGDVLEVPVDDEGMRVDELADRAPSLIYCIPNFQNPSGTTLSLARRERLVELAERWDAVILEDDPYWAIRFSGEPLPSLMELAGGSPHVVRVETFSKILAPGLRVGWVEADPRVVELMVNAKQAMDTCANLPAQRLIEAFLGGGYMTEHIARLRTVYAERRNAMDAALANAFPDATWTRPDGGMFAWLTLPERVDAEALFPAALAEGVAFIPGPAFSVQGRFRNALRLCFAASDPPRIREGVLRLHRAMARHVA